MSPCVRVTSRFLEHSVDDRAQALTLPHHVTNFVPFSGSLLYGNANPIQADDGSDRGPAQGLSRWAKASVGSGDPDRRRRESCARPFSDEFFGVLGQARARQSFLGPGKSGWRGGGKAIEDVLSECAPHPAHALT